MRVRYSLGVASSARMTCVALSWGAVRRTDGRTHTHVLFMRQFFSIILSAYTFRCTFVV